MTIGERAYKAISDRAAEIGMEVKEYAKTIGIDPRNPSYRETGYSEHRSYLLSRLVEAGLDAHWILTGQEDGKVDVVQCKDCMLCYESISSSTGYKCSVWGLYGDDCECSPEGFCNKAMRRAVHG